MLSERLAKKKRRVHLYFNSNDEMVEKEDEESEETNPTDLKLGKDNQIKSGSAESESEAGVHSDLKKKELELEGYHTKITVNLGSEEYNKGKQKITSDFFEGANKFKNAELFIENLQKAKRACKDQHNQPKTAGIDEKPHKKTKGGSESKEEPLIMDLNIQKMAGQDQIFMDLLSLYGSNFIQSKKQAVPNSANKTK